MTTKRQFAPLACRRAMVAGFLLVIAAGPGAQAQGRQGGGDGQSRGGPGTGNPDEHRAPWRFVEKGTPLASTAIITLYWLPASLEEMERSPLLTSRTLLEADLRCVSLLVVVPDDVLSIQKLSATGRLPAAVIVNSQGAIIGRADNVRGALRPAAVEQLVSDELGKRDDAMYHDMANARKLAAAGDRDGAVRLYQRVWDDRCLYPLAGVEAQRALKALGVTVVEVAKPLAVDPGLHAPVAPTTTPPKRKRN